MNRTHIAARTTKYTAAVQQFVMRAGHATNAEILAALQSDYPDLSATTVHRITCRMAERGTLQLAPSLDNTMRYDANLTPHDHFMCNGCGMLKDATLGDTLRPAIEKTIGDGCSISGSLTVSGLCKYCHDK
ncbi:MAG: transcriptional repressor [Candidatus Saccharimonadales bacterium]